MTDEQYTKEYHEHKRTLKEYEINKQFENTKINKYYSKKTKDNA